MKARRQQARRRTFREAVLNTPDTVDCYSEGLQAFTTHDHRRKIIMEDTRLCGGSVELDECVKKKYAQDNRWDYMFDYNDEAYFVEFHTASTSQVSVIIDKLNWLKDWLHHHAPEINKLKAKNRSPFIWVQTNGNHIAKNSPQERRIAQAGLRPVAVLNLK